MDSSIFLNEGYKYSYGDFPSKEKVFCTSDGPYFVRCDRMVKFHFQIFLDGIVSQLSFYYVKNTKFLPMEKLEIFHMIATEILPNFLI